MSHHEGMLYSPLSSRLPPSLSLSLIFPFLFPPLIFLLRTAVPTDCPASFRSPALECSLFLLALSLTAWPSSPSFNARVRRVNTVKSPLRGCSRDFPAGGLKRAARVVIKSRLHSHSDYSSFKPDSFAIQILSTSIEGEKFHRNSLI